MQSSIPPPTPRAGSLSAVLLLLCALCSVYPAAAQTVTFGLNGSGLSSLRYGSQEYLAIGEFKVNSVTMVDSSGQTSSADMQASTTLDSPKSQIRKTYNWGVVTATYAATGSRLNLAISITNNSGKTIRGMFLEPLAVRFPSKPAEYDGNTPILGSNVGNPTVLTMTSGATTLVLCNDDTALPLMIGFPWAWDRPASLTYPLRVNTDRDNMYPDSLPYIDRPVLPGATDTYKLSIRFAPTGTALSSVASDVYSSFARTYPMKLSWPDRRPIGYLVLATAATGWATNPRGWFLDPNINVMTPDGLASFRARVLSWADNSVAVMRKMNSQGMIAWDIEGQQFPHSTSYIGDPRLVSKLAPEMNAIADQFFKKFRDAGFRVGVCIRPDELVVSADGTTAYQKLSANPAQWMIDKISYAKSRWGATLIYVDSNGDPNRPMDVSIFKQIAAAHPDVLLIPEHENAAYYSISAPYGELRGGNLATPKQVVDIYPTAFSSLNLADGSIEPNADVLRASLSRGDVALFRGWWDDPQNTLIKNLLPTTPVASVPPTVAITAPVANSIISGRIDVRADASSAAGLAGVTFYLDSTTLGGEKTAPPYAASVDLATVPNGSHTLRAVARDTAGLTASGNISITVSNPVVDVQPPSVSFSAPASGAVSGVVRVEVAATDNDAVASVRIFRDGTQQGSEITNPPYAISWDSTQAANGNHTLSAIAADRSGNTGTATLAVNVYNALADTTAPVVSFLQPTAGPVSGTVAITASASDNIGVAGVRFLLDGSALGSEQTATPYGTTWNTTAAANGNHTLTAVARDAAGNAGTTTLQVSVNNAVADNIPPTISVVSPANNATISGTINISASASDNKGISSVQYIIDGVNVGTKTTSPYDVPLNAALLTGGVHYLTAVASDFGSNNSASTISFSVGGGQSAPGCSAAGIRVWSGCYYSDTTLTTAVFSRLDGELNFDWGTASPSPSLNARSFSTVWQGAFNFEAGLHKFDIQSSGGVRVYLDGVVVFDRWTATSYSRYEPTATVTAGTHTVRVDYNNTQSNPVLKLHWFR